MSTLKVPVSPRDHRRGGPNAAVTLVEYGDYQCPYCAAAHPVVRFLESRFGPALSVVFRHFPLVEVHPLAAPAAEAAEYAGDHGRFWEMHDAIFSNNNRLSTQLLFALAGTLQLSQMGLRDSIAARCTRTGSARISSAAFAAASTERRPSSSTACVIRAGSRRRSSPHRSRTRWVRWRRRAECALARKTDTRHGGRDGLSSPCRHPRRRAKPLLPRAGIVLEPEVS